MRAILASILVAAAFAGCVNDAPATTSTTASAPTAPATTDNGKYLAVHRSEARLLEFSAFAGELPAFDQVRVTDRISGEPTIAVTRTGAVFYPAIDFDAGVPAQKLPRTIYYRSVDAGESWYDHSPQVGGVPTHPTSFDPYVYADPTTGRVFALDMGPHVACNKVSWSDDDGRTWITRDGACPLPVADHPNIFAGPMPEGVPGVPKQGGGTVGYPNALYICSNQISDVQCSRSFTGGLDWTPSAPVFVGVEPGTVVEDPMGVEWLCGSLTAHGHASFATGTVYLGKVHCGAIMVGVSTDAGTTWTTSTIQSGPVDTHGEHDVSIGTDLDGTAYAFWVGDAGAGVFLSVSKDEGMTWSEPRNVTAPGVTAVKLPSLVAGAPGRIAFQYVGTTTPLGWAVQTPGNESALLNTTWNAYVGISIDADAEDPVFATTTINRLAEPVKRGACEDRCFGNVGGMYDFLDIDMDPRNGRLWTAIVDVCTAECDEPGANADTFQRAMGTVGRQAAGPRLLDEPYPAR